MRNLICILCLLSSGAFAADCHLWTIKGKVVFEKPDFILLSVQETQAETKLVIPLEEQQKLMPFLNHPVETLVLLTESEVPKKGSIMKVISAERIIPDPLRDNQSTVFKKTGKQPCP